LLGGKVHTEKREILERLVAVGDLFTRDTGLSYLLHTGRDLR